MTSRSRGVDFRLEEPAAMRILELNRVAGRAAFDAGLQRGDTHELALLKAACQAYLDIPLVQGLNSEGLEP